MEFGYNDETDYYGPADPRPGGPGSKVERSTCGPSSSYNYFQRVGAQRQYCSHSLNTTHWRLLEGNIIDIPPTGRTYTSTYYGWSFSASQMRGVSVHGGVVGHQAVGCQAAWSTLLSGQSLTRRAIFIPVTPLEGGYRREALLSTNVPLLGNSCGDATHQFLPAALEEGRVLLY